MPTKQYDETNRWSLFPEENKKSDNGPDYTGEADVRGTKYRLAGWKRVSKKSGKKSAAKQTAEKTAARKSAKKTAAKKTTAKQSATRAARAS